MSVKTTKELLNELKSSNNIESYLKNNDAYLSNIPLDSYLNKLLNEKLLKKSTVIDKSGLNQIYGYQIFSGEKHPSRDKVMLLGIAMSLDFDEMQHLLTAAKVDPLYVRRQRDSIIVFSLNKHLSVLQTNEILFDLGEKILE